MSITFTFEVQEIRALSDDISQVFLVSNDPGFKYHAGQYIYFILPGEQPRPYSIANAPQKDHLEFHIRHEKSNAYAQKLMAQLHQHKHIILTKPEGKMRYCTTPAYPLLFMATGTGFAPCKALIEEALKDTNPPKMSLFWGARQQKDLYFHQELLALQNKYPCFSYMPVLGERVYEAVLKQSPNFSHIHVYACGHEQMVLTAQKLFANPPYFYSDWLDYFAQN